MKKQTAGRDNLGHLAPKFAELNDDVLFGEVWSREDKLSLRDRSMITISALMAQGLYPQVKAHLIIGKEHGLTKEEVVEIEDLKMNLKDYDTIILGTPVWWYTMAPPVRSFLKNNDLSGKTIIPFITNGGWIGTTLEDINKLTKGAHVKNEIDIVFEDSNMKTSLVGLTDWIDSI